MKYYPYLKNLGLYNIVSIRESVSKTINSYLIARLVERWHSETHILHLQFREMMVTLQDVSTLWGLPIQDASVGVVFDPSSNRLIDDCIEELLGVWPPDVQTNHGKSKFHMQMTKI